MACAAYDEGMKNAAVLMALVAVMAFSGCEQQKSTDEGTVGQTTSAAPQPSVSATEKVDWSMYPPKAKKSIDKAAKAKNCKALQAKFNTWASSPTGQPTGNTAVVAYIQKKMEAAGCYS